MTLWLFCDAYALQLARACATMKSDGHTAGDDRDFDDKNFWSR